MISEAWLQRPRGRRAPASSSKSVRTVLLAGGLGLSAILVAARLGGAGNVIGAFVAAAGGVILIASWRNLEFGVKSLLVVVIVEGAVRKWFLSTMMVYFYKDFLLAAILLGYHARRHKPPFLIGERLGLLYGAIVFLTIYVLVQAFNPSLPHPLVGLLGVKAYVLYIPLAFLVPRAFGTKEKLVRFLMWYALLALPVCLLGALQFMDTDPGSALNRYAWSEEAAAASVSAVGGTSGIATFQDSGGAVYVRITSTFSFITGLYIYLPVAFALLLGLISLRSANAISGRARWLYFAGVGGVAVSALMTGSRGTILMMAGGGLVFYVLTSARNFFQRTRQFLIGAAVVYVAATVMFPAALDAFYTRAFGGEEQVQEGQSRLGEAFNLPLTEAMHAGAIGYGAGATQNGIPALMATLDLEATGDEIPIRYEGESSRVMLDLGVIGYVLYALLRYGLLFTAFGLYLAISDPESKVLAAAALTPLVFLLVFGGAIVSHTHNVYQWFLAGVPLALLNAERLAARPRAAQRRVAPVVVR